MNVYAEFTPKHFEKAVDIARHIASYAKLEFGAEAVHMTAIDPAKAMYLHTELVPQTYKIDNEVVFGVNINMFYKLLKSLDNNIPIEVEIQEDKMTITQIGHRHELLNQPTEYEVPTIQQISGPVVTLDTKLFQKHIRALSNVSQIIEIGYDQNSSSLFLESYNSLYKTLFAVNTENSPNEAWPGVYSNRFLVKFIESAINPSMGDKVDVHLGNFMMLQYRHEGLFVNVTISNYTEG